VVVVQLARLWWVRLERTAFSGKGSELR